MSSNEESSPTKRKRARTNYLSNGDSDEESNRHDDEEGEGDRSSYTTSYPPLPPLNEAHYLTDTGEQCFVPSRIDDGVNVDANVNVSNARRGQVVNHQNLDDGNGNDNDNEISIISVINAMFQQRDQLLRHQAGLVEAFLANPTDRHEEYGREKDMEKDILNKEGPVKEMNDLSAKISIVAKELRKTRTRIEDDE